MTDAVRPGHPMTYGEDGKISEIAIRDQLERILADREFLATDKMREFLRFVVEETLACREHVIKGYTVATHVFGRSDDFDPGQDPIVSIQAGRLRRALERYYLVAGQNDPIHIDIPKGRYVPRFRRHDADVQPLVGSNSSVSSATSSLPTGPTLAVLPFENLGGDLDQTFLMTGLTDELVTELNRFQDIVVMSCQSKRHRDEMPSNPIEVGRAVSARFVLQGAVRTDSETVKVSTQLTDAKDGRQIWAEAFRHPLEAGRLIATQEEIAARVVSAIGSEFGIIARRLSAESRKKAPAELDTYETMLRYYSHQIDPSPESGLSCFVDLQKAVEREPEYGPAWSALATLHCQMYSMDVPGFDQSLDTALDFARKGVSLEPGSQLGRTILAYACYLADESEGFLEEAETALNLNPNSPYTVGAIGYFHAMRGEFERGLPLLDRAISANPCHPDWFHNGFIIHYLQRRDYEGALVELQKSNAFMSFWLPTVYATILGKLGRIDEAQVYLEQLTLQKPDFASRAYELMWRTLKIDAVLEDSIDGLNKAGLSISSQ